MPWSKVKLSKCGSCKHKSVSFGIALTSNFVRVWEHVCKISTLLEGANYNKIRDFCKMTVVILIYSAVDLLSS